MKRIALYFGIAAALVASCSTQEKDFQAPLQEDVIFYASFEQPAEEGTKVYANEDLLLRWTADDRVSIFNKITYNQQYKFTGETGDNAGGFKKVDSDEFVTGNTIPHVVSVYPYLETTKITESEVITVSLPAEQSYAENTFGLGANTMASVSSDNVLQYKNVGGYLMLKLYGEGVSVSSITLRGNNSEKIAGKASVSMPLDGTPTAVMADNASSEISLTCTTPVQLGPTEAESTQFWFVVPPVTFSNGFTILVNDSTGGYFAKSTSKSISIERNKLSKMSPMEVEIEPTPKAAPSCEVDNITISKCRFTVKIEFNESISTGQVGVLYSTQSDVLNTDNLAVSSTFYGTDISEFSFDVSKLEMNTRYYCLPFVYMPSEGYIYGQPFSFITENITHVTDGDFVDLGIGVLWGSKNLGANSPTEAGDRYAWGELSTKESFSLNNYSLYVGGSYMNIGNSIVNTDYDVCRKKLGNGHHLPYSSNIVSLFTQCSYAFTTYEGVPGVIVQGTNGNSIFLPYLNTNSYSGYHKIEDSTTGYEAHFSGLFAGFMSGELSTESGTNGYVKCLMFSPEITYGPANYKYNQVWYKGYLSRETGQSVRPVYDPSLLQVWGVYLNENEMSLNEGENFQLEATIYPETADNKSVIWSSDDERVASVNGTGLVTAKGKGITKMRVTTVDGGCVDSCLVFVINGNSNTTIEVDMGLSVKWSSLNIGAKSLTDYGGHYAWGEVDQKDEYSWATYKYSEGDSYYLTKYCTSTSSGYNGFVDQKTILEPEDDIAHVSLGGKWRMPTYDEFCELSNKNNCTWKWLSFNNVYGHLITSKITGNSIFLPISDESDGYNNYWFSSLKENRPTNAQRALIYKSGVTGASYFERYAGFCVRPVTD